MFFNEKREMAFFSLLLFIYTLRVCLSVSLREARNGVGSYRLSASAPAGEGRKPRYKEESGPGLRGSQAGNVAKSTRRELRRTRRDPRAGPGRQFQHFGAFNPDGSDFGHKSLSWTQGKVRMHPRRWASPPEDGYQGDAAAPGFHGVQGKVYAPLFNSIPGRSEWLPMRLLVLCDQDVMTFTASGGGFSKLLVDRGGLSPISPLQIPSSCSYSVKPSWRGFELMVPYDACYMKHENGSFVLPMLWSGSPVKLSCPEQITSSAPSLPKADPVVFCSTYGMALQLHLKEYNLPTMRVRVNGVLAPFVSAECAYRTKSPPEELVFFISFSAPCIMIRDRLHLHLVLGEREYILSCPIPSTSSPPTTPTAPPTTTAPHPDTPAPTSPLPSQAPSKEQIDQLYKYIYPYPYLYHIYPFWTQATQAPQTTLDSESQQPTFPYTPEEHQKTPPPSASQSPTMEQIDQVPGHYVETYYPLTKFYTPGPQVTHTPQPATESTPGSQPQQLLYPLWSGKWAPVFVEEQTNVSPSPGTEQISKVITHPPTTHRDRSGTQTHVPYVPNNVPMSWLYPFFPPPGPGKLPYTTGEHQKTPPPQTTSEMKLPVVATQHPSVSDYHYVSYYVPVVSPAPTPATEKPPVVPDIHPQKPPGTSYYPYFLPIQHYHVHTPPTPSSPTHTPKQPVETQSPESQFYPPSIHVYHPYGQFLYPHTPDVPQPSVPPPAPTPLTSPPKEVTPQQLTTPKNPFSQIYDKIPNFFMSTTTPVKGTMEPPSLGHQQPLDQKPPCHACNYPHFYSYFYTPHPLHQGPSNEPTVTAKQSTISTAATPSLAPQPPYLQCLTKRMEVFLPFAHPDSIQVRDQTRWLFLPNVTSRCGYMIQAAGVSGVILHSPLPACHSLLRTHTTISLPLRYWDLSMQKYRTLDLQCPYQTVPPSVVPPVSPTQPSTTESQTMLPVFPKPAVFCSAHQMTLELPPGSVSEIAFKDITGTQVTLVDAPKHCGYSAVSGNDGKINLILQLNTNCHMRVEDKMYIITIVFMTQSGRREDQYSCPVLSSGSGKVCNLPSEQQLPCGHGSLPQSHCLSMGCCFSQHTSACYYPMDECTIDRHFVFSVPATLTNPPLSPDQLVVASNLTCQPLKVTSEYALFKIPLDGCGTHRVEVGKSLIYLVEIINRIPIVSHNYATITRDSPVRVLVECRYVPGPVLSVSYLVKTPNLGPSVQTQGVFGVQLRIARDSQYSSFYPQYHQPLQMLLKKPLYLEVRLLNAPDPNLVLLVHYCVAYPRSGKALWVLLYNGCPNPLDPAPQKVVLSEPSPPLLQAQTRRFNISTFQFLPDGEFKDQEEEIYFMCSTEICSSREGPCVEGCFSQSWAQKSVS